VPSVFISYFSNDMVKIERLAEALRQEQGIAVWLDTTNIYPGNDFLEEMKKGIQTAEKIIICLSPSFNGHFVILTGQGTSAEVSAWHDNWMAGFISKYSSTLSTGSTSSMNDFPAMILDQTIQLIQGWMALFSRTQLLP
jgi:hypothetical protein